MNSNTIILLTAISQSRIQRKHSPAHGGGCFCITSPSCRNGINPLKCCAAVAESIATAQGKNGAFAEAIAVAVSISICLHPTPTPSSPAPSGPTPSSSASASANAQASSSGGSAAASASAQVCLQHLSIFEELFGMCVTWMLQYVVLTLQLCLIRAWVANTKALCLIRNHLTTLCLTLNSSLDGSVCSTSPSSI